MKRRTHYTLSIRSTKMQRQTGEGMNPQSTDTHNPFTLTLAGWLDRQTKHTNDQLTKK
jgi:hypothetical protein